MGRKTPPKPAAPPVPSGNMYASMLAGDVREAHGEGAANTLDVSENLGDPRGYISWGNIAITRLLGSDFPLGRFVEVSGWEASGKSTLLDQLLVQTQRSEAGQGIGVLADTERTRQRAYMAQLGVIPERLVWIEGRTVESMFEQVETIVRRAAHHNNKAWADALARAKIKVGTLPTRLFRVFDPNDKRKGDKRKPVAQWDLVQWDHKAKSALLEYQRREKLPTSGIRDKATRERLRPVILFVEDPKEVKEVLGNWEAGIADTRCQPADTPLVIGWDSVAGTGTEAEMDGSIRDVHPAAAAKIIRQGLRRMVQLIDDQAIGWLLVNQRYEKIEFGGKWSKAGSGRRTKEQSETYGGGGIKFASTARLELFQGKAIFASNQAQKDGEPPIGQEVLVKVHKNKLGPPFRQGTFGLLFGRGAVDAYTIHVDLFERGIVAYGGGWYRFTDPTILTGLGATDGSWRRGWQGLEELITNTPGLKAKLDALYMEGAPESWTPSTGAQNGK